MDAGGVCLVQAISSGAVSTVIKELKPWSPTAPHIWLLGLLFLTEIPGSPHVVCESLALVYCSRSGAILGASSEWHAVGRWEFLPEKVAPEPVDCGEAPAACRQKQLVPPSVFRVRVWVGVASGASGT